MIDTDKYEGHTPGPWKNFKVIDKETNDKFIQRGFHADLDLMIDAPLLLEEVKRLQYSYDMAVKQLQNTRLWIAKYEGVLKEMANQASFVKCSALNIDEWIEGVKL